MSTSGTVGQTTITVQNLIDHGARRAGKLAEMRQLWLAHPLTAGRPEVRAAMAAMLLGYDGRDLVSPGRPLTVTPDDVKRIAVRATALAGEDDTP